MDGNGNGKIDIQEFVLALAICIRGSSDEKLNCFIFNFFFSIFFSYFPSQSFIECSWETTRN